jgi:hypothetical protein
VDGQPFTVALNINMSADNNDVFSRPYEEWPGNESIKREMESSRRISQSKAFSGKVFTIFIMGLFGFWLLSSLLRYVVLGDAVFIQNEKFENFSKLLVILLVSIFSIWSLFAKITKRIDLDWFGLIVFGLTIGFFVWLGVHVNLGALITTVGVDPQESKMILYKSTQKISGRRGCKVRNEFYLEGEIGKGMWCPSSQMRLGTYLVTAKIGALGSLVMQLPKAEIDNK